MHGLILNGSKNVFEVECEDGLTRDCSIKGKILKSDKDYYNPIAPGDIVELEEASLEEKKDASYAYRSAEMNLCAGT